MRIINRTRSTLVGSRVQVADTWWGRLRGYLGRGEPQPGEGILLIPCKAVHTCGMRYDLDIIFLDNKGRILDLVSRMRPWRSTKRIAGARYVLEVPAGTVEETGTQVGDLLSWQLDRPTIPHPAREMKPAAPYEASTGADQKGTPT